MISRCFDEKLIKQAITHSKIYPHVSDDGSPLVEDYSPPMGDSLYYLAVFEDAQFMGVFFYHPQNSFCYEVHTCLLPIAWGRSAEFGKESIQWIFQNTDCKRIVTNVPAYNAHAIRLARKVGMTQYGTNTKSFMKNGILHDQIMLGVSKEAVCQ